MRPPPHQRLSQETMRRFVETLSTTGNITLASQAVGITTTTAYVWKNRSKANPKDERYLLRDPLGEDPDTTFHEAWEAAADQSLHLVSDQAMQLATGYQEPVIFQGRPAYKPDFSAEFKFDPLSGLPVYPPELDPLTGEPIPLTVRKVSEKMIDLILKSRHPAYKPKQEVDVTSGGKPFAVPERAQDMGAFLAAFGRKPETE